MELNVTRVTLNVVWLLCMLATTLGIKSTHVLNQLNVITELMEEEVDMEPTDVAAIMSKLHEIEAKVIMNPDAREKHTNAKVVSDTRGPNRGVNTIFEIIQKAFKAEKEMTTRIRRDQLAMEEKLSSLESKAGKCELTPAFLVLQTSHQLLKSTQQIGKDIVVKYLTEIQNQIQQIQKTISTSVALDNQIANNVRLCINSSLQLKNDPSSLVDTAKVKPMSCADIDSDKSGVYTVHPKFKPSGIQVYCELKTGEEGWIVFQRRKDGFTDFYRDWDQYKNGFGDLGWEFWLGNDNLHGFTFERPSELRVDLVDENGKRGYAKYSLFKLNSELEGFSLIINGFSGNIGDSLKYHNNKKFSTFDRDSSTSGSCASVAKGAWWYGQCYHSNLNGDFFNNVKDKTIRWIHGHNSKDVRMVATEMKLRWKY